MKTSLIIILMTTFFFMGCSNGTTDNEQNASANLNVKTWSVQRDSTITNKYWKLITLEGKKVTMAENQERETHFILRPEEHIITGFAGCNTFNGTYTLKDGWRIHFSKMASTLKLCPDVDVNEAEFLQVFELADNYTVHEDTLSLNVGKRAPLAVFKAVYFD